MLAAIRTDLRPWMMIIYEGWCLMYRLCALRCYQVVKIPKRTHAPIGAMYAIALLYRRVSIKT